MVWTVLSRFSTSYFPNIGNSKTGANRGFLFRGFVLYMEG